MPPIILGQFFMLPDGSAFATWGFFSAHIAQGWVDRTHRIKAEDWRSGNELWMVDLVAPFGNVRQLIRELRKIFPKKTVAHGTRSYGTDKVQRVTEWINA